MKTKVIIVGMCQSGNLDLAAAIHMRGYNTMGYHRAAYRCAQQRGDFSCFDNMVDTFDSLRDYPFNIWWERIADKHPTAKFILTRRADLNHWFDKLKDYTHTEKKHADAHKHWWYTSSLEEEDREFCKDVHEQHCNKVRSVLGDRLLEFCIDENPGWKPLCDFLGITIPAAPFPTKETRFQTIEDFSQKYDIAWMVWDNLIPQYYEPDVR